VKKLREKWITGGGGGGTEEQIFRRRLNSPSASTSTSLNVSAQQKKVCSSFIFSVFFVVLNMFELEFEKLSFLNFHVYVM